MDFMLEVLHTAEDGLDPGDALVAEEALARILVLFRAHYADVKMEQSELGALYYGDDPSVGGPPVICLMRWDRDGAEDKQARAAWRDRFERARLVSGWDVAG